MRLGPKMADLLEINGTCLAGGEPFSSGTAQGHFARAAHWRVTQDLAGRADEGVSIGGGDDVRIGGGRECTFAPSKYTGGIGILRRPPRPRPPYRRSLPRGPDGDALGRCLIRRSVGSSWKTVVGNGKIRGMNDGGECQRMKDQ